MSFFNSMKRFLPALALVGVLFFSVAQAQAQGTIFFEIQNNTSNTYPQVLFKICEINNPGNCIWVDPNDVLPNSMVVPGTNNYQINTPGPGWEVRSIVIADASGTGNNALIGTCPGFSDTDDIGNDPNAEPIRPVSTAVWVSSSFACIYD